MLFYVYYWLNCICIQLINSAKYHKITMFILQAPNSDKNYSTENRLSIYIYCVTLIAEYYAQGCLRWRKASSDISRHYRDRKVTAKLINILSLAGFGTRTEAWCSSVSSKVQCPNPAIPARRNVESFLKTIFTWKNQDIAPFFRLFMKRHGTEVRDGACVMQRTAESSFYSCTGFATAHNTRERVLEYEKIDRDTGR